MASIRAETLAATVRHLRVCMWVWMGTLYLPKTDPIVSVGCHCSSRRRVWFPRNIVSVVKCPTDYSGGITRQRYRSRYRFMYDTQIYSNHRFQSILISTRLPLPFSAANVYTDHAAQSERCKIQFLVTANWPNRSNNVYMLAGQKHAQCG